MTKKGREYKSRRNLTLGLSFTGRKLWWRCGRCSCII